MSVVFSFSFLHFTFTLLISRSSVYSDFCMHEMANIPTPLCTMSNEYAWYYVRISAVVRFVLFHLHTNKNLYRTVYIEFFIPTKWYSLTHTNANCVLKPQHKHLCAVIFSTNLPFKFRFIFFYHHPTTNHNPKYSLEIKKNRKPSAAFV